jgi:hypothetical protein
VEERTGDGVVFTGKVVLEVDIHVVMFLVTMIGFDDEIKLA